MKIGYRVERDVKLSPVKYLNQCQLNFTQLFASNSDYIFNDLLVLQHLKMNNQINMF